MNKLTTLLPATFLVLACRLAAEPEKPESSFGLAPSSAPQLAPPTPGAAPSSNPLIPDSLQPTEKPAKAAAQPSDRTAVAEDKLKHKIQLRLAKNKAEREPDLIALKAKAYAAPTDFEQRKLFQDYYTALAERMGKLDPTLAKEEVEGLRAKYSAQYYQLRISPTVDPATFRKHN